MSTEPPTYRLPNFLDGWPWPRKFSPHFLTVEPEARAWVEEFAFFSPEAQRAYNAYNLCLFGALGLTYHPPERFRSACDVLNVFFIYDDATDIGDKEGIQGMADIAMDAVRYPTKARPTEEPIIGEIIRQSWGKCTLTAPPVSRKRFIDGMDEHTAGGVEQADDRSRGYLPMRDISSYFKCRRLTVGAHPIFAFIAFDFDLPAYVFEDPVVKSLEAWGCDLLILSNDLYSYPKEYKAGDGAHNIVAIVMNELGVDLAGAVGWAQNYQDRLMKDFVHAVQNLQSFGDKTIDDQLKGYIDGIGTFIRGHDCWCFESARYFGKNGSVVQKERVVQLVPPKET